MRVLENMTKRGIIYNMTSNKQPTSSSPEKTALNTLLECFNEEAENIIKFVSNQSNVDFSFFDKPSTFNTENLSLTPNTFKDLKSKCGIYVIYNINGICVGTIKRNKDNFNKTAKGAQIYDNTLCDANDNFNYIYLGKSYKLCDRLTEHFLKQSKSTYSLKYAANERKDLLGKLDIFVFILKENYKDYQDIVLSSIETILHEKSSPLVGSPRV